MLVFKTDKKKGEEKEFSESESIEDFLKRHNLGELIPFVEKLQIKTVGKLRNFRKEDIKTFLGPEREQSTEKLLKALEVKP